MNYTVHWTRAAEDELADLWRAASDKKEFLRIAGILDDRLAVNGPDEGESRAEDERIVFEPPIGVLIEVNIATRLIRVLHVWVF
jgi:hypothetical protein